MDGVAPSPMVFDLGQSGVRALNRWLHAPSEASPGRRVEVQRPQGQHNVAVGARSSVLIEIHGHVGYYAGGMNQKAQLRILGNAGKGLAENIMSGEVEVEGDASDSVAASGHAGLVIVRGNAASRCGISMKGVEIVVGGNVGHLGAFMAQAGTLVVCGDAGAGLGDSLFEAVIYVAGHIEGLGADAQEEPMTPADDARVEALLGRARLSAAGRRFKRIASARRLYHFNVGDDRTHG